MNEQLIENQQVESPATQPTPEHTAAPASVQQPPSETPIEPTFDDTVLDILKTLENKKKAQQESKAIDLQLKTIADRYGNEGDYELFKTLNFSPEQAARYIQHRTVRQSETPQSVIKQREITHPLAQPPSSNYEASVETILQKKLATNPNFMKERRLKVNIDAATYISLSSPIQRQAYTFGLYDPTKSTFHPSLLS